MATINGSAPGGPGSPARWSSSAKTGVGTALSNASHVCFTLSHGIFNDAPHWEGADFAVRIGPLRPDQTASAYKSEADADQG